MKIIVNGTDLSSAVMKVSKAISSKTTNPVLEGIKLSVRGDELTLSATDTEIAIEKTIRSDTFLEGDTVVPGKLFAELVKKLETEDQVELNKAENRVRVFRSISFRARRGRISRDLQKHQRKIFYFIAERF